MVKPKGKHQATIVWLHGLGDNGSRFDLFLIFIFFVYLSALLKLMKLPSSVEMQLKVLEVECCVAYHYSHVMNRMNS